MKHVPPSRLKYLKTHKQYTIFLTNEDVEIFKTLEKKFNLNSHKELILYVLNNIIKKELDFDNIKTSIEYQKGYEDGKKQTKKEILEKLFRHEKIE